MRQYCLIGLLMLTGCRDPLIEEAKQALLRNLDDPYSARIDEVQRCAKPNAVIGKFNEKNKYGGFVGKRTFLYVNRRIFTSETATSEALDAAGRACFSDAVLNEADALYRKMAD
jgi:hypothetical protein